MVKMFIMIRMMTVMKMNEVMNILVRITFIMIKMMIIMIAKLNINNPKKMSNKKTPRKNNKCVHSQKAENKTG